MIAVRQAMDIILQNVGSFGTEWVALEEATHRILAEEIIADRPVPPFDRVAMDGIAIAHAAFARGQRSFPIEGTVGAGDPMGTLKDASACVEIMTGACLTEGADTVIRYEDVVVRDGVATIEVDELDKGKNIHRKGKDAEKGAVLIPKNRAINAVDLCILASEGKHRVKVYRTPRVGIISSGDELVEVDEIPLPHQIRRSNVYVIQALIESFRAVTNMYHLKDNKSDIEGGLKKALSENDVLILVGGVSKGKFDYIPEILTRLGAEKLFHRIAQRPGKPFWFGSLGKQRIFALPGNPVSSIMCTVRYFIPWLRASTQLDYDYSQPAILAEDFTFRPALTRFVEVSLELNEMGRLLATTKVGNGSGDFLRLADAHGFMEFPADRSEFAKGEVFPVWRFRH